jgi:hypothetical protein
MYQASATAIPTDKPWLAFAPERRGCSAVSRGRFWRPLAIWAGQVLLGKRRDELTAATGPVCDDTEDFSFNAPAEPGLPSYTLLSLGTGVSVVVGQPTQSYRHRIVIAGK